ncbi:hypothetical protein GCM10020218_091750 [Dactylosporangium vinaceum]
MRIRLHLEHAGVPLRDCDEPGSFSDRPALRSLPGSTRRTRCSHRRVPWLRRYEAYWSGVLTRLRDLAEADGLSERD